MLCVHRSAEDCYLHWETLGMHEERLFFHADQLFRGLYAPYLWIWQRFLPASHILVINSDDYFADPDAVTNRVLQFLGLPLLPGDGSAHADTAAGAATSKRAGTQMRAAAGMSNGNAGAKVISAATDAAAQPGFLDANAADRVRKAGPRQSRRPPDLGPVPAATRRALTAFYAPYNKQLAQMLGDDRILRWSQTNE